MMNKIQPAYILRAQLGDQEKVINMYTIEPYNEASTIFEVWQDNAVVCFMGTQEECQEYIDAQ